MTRLILLILAAAPLAARDLPVTFRLERQSGGGYWRAVARVPVFPAADRLGSYANRAVADLVAAAVEEFRVAVADATQDGKPPVPYQIDLTTTVSLATDQVISLYTTEVTYTGGAHPNSAFRVLNVAMRDGLPVEVKLEDVLTPPDRAERLANELLIGRLKQVERASWVVSGEVTEFEPPTLRRFILTPTAVSWLIQPYEAAPYAAGEFVVKVPLSELGERLNRGGAMSEVWGR